MSTFHINEKNNKYPFQSLKKNPSATLDVARENFSASTPPLRTINITQEIKHMMNRQSLIQSIQQILSKPV